MSPSRSTFPPQDPYLLAVISPYPEIAQFLRDVQWLAREQGLGIALAVRRQDWLRRWLNRNDREIDRFAARWEIPIASWHDAGEVVGVIGGDPEHRPAGLVFGPTRPVPWRAGLSESESRRIGKTAANVGVPVLTDLTEDIPAETPVTLLSLQWRLDQRQPWYQAYILTVVAVALAGVVVAFLRSFLPPAVLAIVFLAAVIYGGSAYGFAAAAFAAVLSVAFNAAVLMDSSTPERTTSNLLLFLLFLVVGAVTSGLSGGLRRAAATAQRRAGETRVLFQLTREIAVASDPTETFRAIIRQIDDAFACRAVLLAPFHSRTLLTVPSARTRAAALQVAYPPDAHLTQDELEAARWCFTHRAPAGRGTAERPDVDAHVAPLETTDGMVAVLLLQDIPLATTATTSFKRIMGSLSRLAAIAVERSLRKQEIEDARVLAHTEGLRSALLSSISHDFGTPLSSIIGSASSLLSYGGTYAPDVTHELLTTILEEAERLSRFVKNLMQMTRLEAGVLVPHLKWADVEDLVATSLDAVARRIQNHHTIVDMEERLPLVHIDFVLMESVLVNVLDNAAKYAPAETAVQITARRVGDEVTIDVTDQGRGISAEDLGAVFDKFHRTRQRDRTVPGTGLGLAICKGIVEAHGGSIEALSPGLGRGTTIRIRLPVKVPDTADMAET